MGGLHTMTKNERAAILAAAKRINDLASMKNACFGIDAEKDKLIKDGVRPYMMWFEIVAMHLEDLATAEDKYDLERAIHDLLRG
jgi:hypothetical protein